MMQRMCEVEAVTRQLACDSARILDWVQGLPGRVDRLVAAALDRDWREVDRLSEELTSQSAAGCDRLREQAAALRRALAQPNNEATVRRLLVRLIFECGRVDPRNIEPRRPLQAARRRSGVSLS